MSLTLKNTLNKDKTTLEQKFIEITNWSIENNLSFSYSFNFDNGYEYPNLLLSVKDNESPDKRSVSVLMNEATLTEVSITNKRRKNLPPWIIDFEKMLPEFKNLILKYPPKIKVSKHHFFVKYESDDGKLYPDPDDYSTYEEYMSFILPFTDSKDQIENQFKNHLESREGYDEVYHVEEIKEKRETLLMTFDEINPNTYNSDAPYVDSILKS